MKFNRSLLLMLVVLHSVAWAGKFRKDQDFQSIEGFGGLIVASGRPFVGNEGRKRVVPLGTQFRLNDGPYFTYDPDGKSTAIGTAPGVNLASPWRFDVQKRGDLPFDGGRYDQRYTQTTFIRVQADAGPLTGWYLGVDRAAIKAHEEKAAEKPEDPTKEPPSWPLVLVKDSADALVFIHRISGVYGDAKRP
jgi:hypothetical protein